MRTFIIALLSGFVFGLGLAVSEMTDPARVVGFLDVAGRWDPTLLFVMGAALAVTLPGFALALRRPRPLCGDRFVLPAKNQIDAPLIAGAAIFGLGWGLSGFCPGPAVAALSTLSPSVAVFVAAMIAGRWLAARIELRFLQGSQFVGDDGGPI
jgi:uncharacterized membrane protein YedE/YeeE